MQYKRIQNKHYDPIYIQHTKKYTEFLEIFVKTLRRSSILKFWLKLLFFIIIVSIMIGMYNLFSNSLDNTFNIIKVLNATNNDSIENIISAIVPVITSFSTMMVSLIKLPEIIAHYLFNTEEDKNMAEIIGKIQNYDVQMFSLEQQIKSLINKQQEHDFDNIDNNIKGLDGEVIKPDDYDIEGNSPSGNA